MGLVMAMSSAGMVTIRRGTVGDAENIAALAARLFAQAYGRTHPEPELSRYLARSFSSDLFARTLLTDNHCILLAEDAGGTACGYAYLRLTNGTLPQGTPARRAVEIVRFYVDEARHGQGVAQVLMSGCEREATAWRADALWLGVWQEAARPIAFYERAGFTIVGTTTFEFGVRRDTDYVMIRPVASQPLNCGRVPRTHTEDHSTRRSR